MNALDITAFVLVIVGALNWGLVAFGVNLVSLLFGAVPYLETAVYLLVGLSALYLAFAVPAKSTSSSRGLAHHN